MKPNATQRGAITYILQERFGDMNRPFPAAYRNLMYAAWPDEQDNEPMAVHMMDCLALIMSTAANMLRQEYQQDDEALLVYINEK